MEGNNIKKVFAKRGSLRCVQFDSGNVGVVNAQGEKVLEIGRCEWLKFGEKGFLKGYSGREFFIDMRNGEPYSSMPELLNIGGFELAYVGGYICTRTQTIYEVSGIPEMVCIGKKCLFLILPVDGEPEECIREKMLTKERHFNVCLLNGDESGVYWYIGEFKDGTVLVMEDDGSYYHVTRNARSGKAVKNCLGKVNNEADKAMMVQQVHDIEEEVVEALKNEADEARRKTEKERKELLVSLLASEPFCNGKKWGLKNNGRIVVPPIYHAVNKPVGKYCAVESYPGIWGVIAVDGKVAVEPKYEKVVILPDGTAELTIFGNKVVRKKLP